MASIFTQESDAGFNLFRTINHNAAPNPIWRSQTTRGTAASPTASQTSDVLLYIAARGYGATTDGGDRAYILAQCSENWTDSAQGASLSFSVTPTGGTSTTTSLIIQPSGQLQALSGSAAVPEYSFLSDTDTGIYSVGADSLGISVGGTVRYTQTTTTGTLASRIVISPVATTSSTALRVNTASNTNQSFSTADVYFNVTAAKTFAGSGSGVLFQGAIYVDIPDWTGSYSTSTTSVLHFAGPATLTGISGDNYVIYIDSGYSSLGDAIQMLTTGTASFPSYSWQSDSNTGMYRIGADSIGFATNGTLRVTINNTAVTLTTPLRTGDGSNGSPSHSFSNDTDCGMYRITSNRFGFSSNGELALQIDTSSVASAAGAVLNRVNIPAQTITITGSTNITTATGFNLHSIGIPTYSAGSALTITNAATVYIGGAPIGGGAGPATITNAYALWIDAGNARFDGVILGSAGTINDCAYSTNGDPNTGIDFPSGDSMRLISGGTVELGINPAAVTSAAGATLNRLSTTAQTIVITGSTNITTATGFNFVNISQPTYSAGSALTVDLAASLYISNAPTGGGAGPATITTAYAFWIDSGVARMDGQIQGGDGSAGTPSYSFQTDTNTGIYRVGADDIGFSTGGTLRLDISTTFVTSTLPIDISGIAAGTANFKITKTSDTPVTTWTAGIPSNDPSGFIEITEGGGSKYIPFWT
jgi:hypothetical protein